MTDEYENHIQKLNSILICEVALMKTGIKKINQSLLYAYSRVIEDLMQKQQQEQIESVEEVET